MTYHAISGEFTVTEKELKVASRKMISALKLIRSHAGLPLTKYKLDNLSDADLAQKSIIDAADSIGISFGVEYGHELDLTQWDA